MGRRLDGREAKGWRWAGLLLGVYLSIHSQLRKNWGSAADSMIRVREGPTGGEPSLP
jgi:hypothetical protein